MDERAYVVAVKPSARKRSAAAGELVATHGPRWTFRSKHAARRWAVRASEPGRRVWIQDANPNDPADVDGYLVGGERVAQPGGEEDAAWWQLKGQVPLGAFDRL